MHLASDIRPKRRGQLATAAVMAVLATMITVVAVGLGAGTATGEETPEQRCARETATYNSAWESTWRSTNPGNPGPPPPPPVPYVCHDPGTQPSTTTTTPPLTAPGLAPTQAPGEGAEGRAGNAPGRLPEGNGTDIVPGPTSAAIAPPQRAPSDLPPVTTPPNPPASSGASVPPVVLDRTPVKEDSPPPQDPPSEGDVISPPDGEERPAFGHCPSGQHGSAKPLDLSWSGVRCYSDYDYRVVNVRAFPDSSKDPKNARPIGKYQSKTGPVKLSQSVTVSSQNSVSENSEVSADLGANLGDVSASVAKKSGSSQSIVLTEESTNASEMSFDTDVLEPGWEIHAYPRYNLIKYDLQKIDTRSGKVVETVRDLEYFEPIQGVDWRRIKVS